MNGIRPYSQLVVGLFATLLSAFASAEPLNLGQLKHRLIRYHDSGSYQREIEIVAAKATHYIDSQVQINEHHAHPKKLAIVLDIDETSLSNYANMRATDFSALTEQVNQQIAAADEPAIQPILSLYQNALHHNVAVFFITGREEILRDATVLNLHNAGYTSWSGLELKTKPMATIIYKTSARAKIEAQGYTIIASVGDQYSDLIGGYAQKTFKIPNPYYYLP